jgi:hypothetical protein
MNDGMGDGPDVDSWTDVGDDNLTRVWSSMALGLLVVRVLFTRSRVGQFIKKVDCGGSLRVIHASSSVQVNEVPHQDHTATPLSSLSSLALNVATPTAI